MKKTKIPEMQIAATTNQARYVERLRQLTAHELPMVAGGTLKNFDCW